MSACLCEADEGSRSNPGDCRASLAMTRGSSLGLLSLLSLLSSLCLLSLLGLLGLPRPSGEGLAMTKRGAGAQNDEKESQRRCGCLVSNAAAHNADDD